MARLLVNQWGEFQHYKHRSPPWIKLHKKILDNYDYQCLPLASRALAPMIWLLASESDDGSIEYDPIKLAFRLRTSEKEIEDAILPLINNGFLIDASGMLAGCMHDASEMLLQSRVEEEKRREDYEPKGSLSDSSNTDVKAKRTVIPYEKIVAIYHQCLPSCPKVEILTSKRRSQIGARWSSKELDTLESWESFFSYCAQSKFLMGAVDPAPGRNRFIADLEWLTKESNYTKIVEGKYHG